MVMFDLDGTLVDSVPLHTVTWWQAMARHGVDLPMHEIQPLIGMGGPQMLDTLLGRDDPEIRTTQAELYAPVRDLARLLPGALDVLRVVRGRGAQAVVVTSSSPQDADALMGRLALGLEVDGIVHGEDVETAKPAPDLFQVALERWSCDPDRAVAVGDSEWDIRAAGQAGVASIGVVTGVTPADNLFRAGAASVCRSCSDLAAAWDS